jgi:AcrR family transcriptional regulator
VCVSLALRDAREQMFAAVERILLREGPHALTSRAVTTEAEVAKGVLHRHFADFDAFLAELVEDRIARIGAQAAALYESAGTGTVAGNLTGVLTGLFSSVAVAIVRTRSRPQGRDHSHRGLIRDDIPGPVTSG